MTRGQGILKRWKEEKEKIRNDTVLAPLEIVMELQYQNYVHLCYWTYIKPLKYTAWLLEPIK